MLFFFFFFQAEDGIRDPLVTGVQTCALPISSRPALESRKPTGRLWKPIARLPGDRCDASLRRGDFVRPIENPRHDVIGAAFVVIQRDHLASLTGSAIAEDMTRRRLDPERIVRLGGRPRSDRRSIARSFAEQAAADIDMISYTLGDPMPRQHYHGQRKRQKTCCSGLDLRRSRP